MHPPPPEKILAPLCVRQLSDNDDDDEVDDIGHQDCPYTTLLIGNILWAGLRRNCASAALQQLHPRASVSRRCGMSFIMQQNASPLPSQIQISGTRN